MNATRPDSEAVIRAHLAGMQDDRRSHKVVGHRLSILRRLASALPVPLPDATSGMLAEWQASLTVATGSAQHYAKGVREFYAWLAAAGFRDDNPAADLPVIPGRAPKPKAEVISDSCMRKIIGQVQSPSVRWWLALGWAGLSSSQIASIRVCDLALGRSPVALVPPDKGIGVHRAVMLHLPPLTGDALMNCGSLPRSAYIAQAPSGIPRPPEHVTRMCNAELRRQGAGITLGQLAAQRRQERSSPDGLR